ncbi:cysteate racemase [Alkaliphilus transvaalensis]|uniref:aspartate/glutamate racemase family protein n=1 Tax=Alkaliphilus transvaalensis TaxID=114628 RepID=UPI0004798FA8|nr:amino acid racemase [Alkaliphilus transvaalensis]
MKKVIGILGGMGPEATVLLFDKIIKYTPAEKDQDHIPILIDNNVLIPDRTAFILGKGTSPVDQLIFSAKRLEKMGANCIVIPCNTAHYFCNEIKKEISIPIISMLKSTTEELVNHNLYGRKVALLATLGTYHTKIYDNILKLKGINILNLKDDQKNRLFDIIYQVKRGNLDYRQKEMISILKYCKNNECNIVILGCTELSVYFNKLLTVDVLQELDMDIKIVDPLDILAKKAVEYAIYS